jgi:hypothetical protein
MANRNIQFYKDATKILGGDSGKRDYDWRRQMAEALLKTGGSTTPVKSIGEGITRALSGVAGGYFAGEARRSEEEKQNAGRAEVFNMLKAYNAPGGQPAYDAVVNAPMDIDETSDDVDRDAQAAFEQRGGISALSKPTTRGGENMQMALMMDDMQQRQATEAAELKRSQGMEDFGEKQRIKAQYKVDPYQRPYDSTAAIKNAADLKRLRLALENAKGPAAIKRAKQNLRDFEFVLSKTLTAIQAQSAAKAAGTQAIKESGNAWESLGKVNISIGNMTDAIAAIDAGAKSGPIEKYFPDIRASSVELNNIRNRMGLDVIGGVTFGALSKGELDLALSTALPTGLDEPKLRDWLVKKRTAQGKLAKYLSSAAIYLGKPGNTVSKWAEMQKKRGKRASNNDPLGIRPK